MMLTWMVLVVLMKALILNVTALGLDKGCVVDQLLELLDIYGKDIVSNAGAGITSLNCLVGFLGDLVS